MLKPVYQWLLLAGLLLLSLLVRYPNLNRPLSKHHEFITAHALNILNVWQQEGLKHTNYAPCLNYSGATNKWINNYGSSSGLIHDDNGNYYYLSHPPLAYYLPYLIFKGFGISFTVLPIQLFNITLQWVGVLLLFGFCRQVFKWDSTALLITGVYLFLMPSLWFQQNTYMSDIAVQVFFIAGLWSGYNLLLKPGIRYALLSLLITFLMAYTSWLGYFFAMALVLAGLYIFLKQGFKSSFLILLPALGALTAFLLTAWQYSAIAGWDALWAEWRFRLAERDTVSNLSLHQLQSLALNYIFNYMPVFVFMILGWLLVGIGHGFSLNKKLLWLTLAPVVLLHLFLLDYSGHDFTVLYAAPFLAIALGDMFRRWLRIKPVTAVVVICLYVLFSVGAYYYINRPGAFSWKGDRYAVAMEHGQYIARNVDDDEVAFLLNRKPTPQEIYYAGRNIKRVTTLTDAKTFLMKHGHSKGVLFGVAPAEQQEEEHFIIIERINLQP